MHRRRFLAFRRDRQPKSLLFSVVLAAAASACSHNPAPGRNSVHPALRENIQKETEKKKDCPRLEIRSWLEPEERILEKRCLYGIQFVLTDTSLLIGMDTSLQNPFSSVILESVHSRTDMRGIFEQGLVGWAVTLDMAYFLTKDRKLTVIPTEGEIDTVNSYDIPFDTADAKIHCRSGFLFIAGRETLMVVSFSDGADSRIIPFTHGLKDPDFYEHKGRLFFGNETRMVEIKTKGRKLDDITVR